MKLSEWLRTFLPTASDVAFFGDHGWYVTPKILSDDLLELAVRGAERYWAGERDWPVPVYEGFRDWNPGSRDALRVNEFVGLQSRAIRALIEQPILGAIAARLVGATLMRHWETELIYKPPTLPATKAAVGWHTDRAYWMTCSSSKMVSAWIPLHDCPMEMGPLMVVDGSHRWSELDHNLQRGFLNNDLQGRAQRLMERRADAKVIPIELSKGQVSFHHAQTLHASDANRSDRPRTSVALHLQDGENRYRPHLNERGELWRVAQDRLCRKTATGDPDYTDPAICPVLWDDQDEPLPARRS